MTALLEAVQLAKTYRTGGVDALALRGVDVSLEEGEFAAIVGASGSGKSTLLHLLGGLDRPTAGQVRLDGRRIDALPERELALLRRRSVGFVFQFFNLLPTLSVAENIELPALLIGASPREARARRDELLGLLGLKDRGDGSPAQLSGGQQQRVAVARALVNRPTVVLADEPTGNLDSRSAQDVLRLLREAHAKGQSLLLVTHDARVAAAADRVITLRDGLVVDEAELDEPRPVSHLLDVGTQR